MDIFIFHFGLFAAVGGGETFYDLLIRANPDERFFFPIAAGLDPARLPANAHPVTIPPSGLGPPGLGGEYAFALDVAAALSGRSFDIVEIPEFMLAGFLFLAVAPLVGLRFGRGVLSLHGALSITQPLARPMSPEALAGMRFHEHMAQRCADIRYGLSRPYIRRAATAHGMPIEYFDPMPFFPPLDGPPAEPPSDEPPSLSFIGRREATKGPDLFLLLAASLPAESFSRARLIGPPAPMDADLTAFIRRVGLKADLLPAMNRDELDRVFRSRTLVVAPSRFDSLNLVVLEALARGCPVAVSRRAGVAEELADTFPELPVFDIDDLAAAGYQVAEALTDYDARRARLGLALRRWEPSPPVPIRRIYESAPITDPEAQILAGRFAADLLRRG